MKVFGLYAVVRKAWVEGESLPSIEECLTLVNNPFVAKRFIVDQIEGYKQVFPDATAEELNDGVFLFKYTSKTLGPIAFIVETVQCDATVQNIRPA